MLARGPRLQWAAMEQQQPSSAPRGPVGRPILDESPPATRLEPLLDALARLGLMALFASLIWIWPRLPEVVPRHFGFDGRPDAWGGRGCVLIVPLIALALYAGLGWCLQRPQLYSFPWPLTEDNAPRQMQLARELLRAVRAWMVLVFATGPWLTWRVASGAQQQLDPGFLPLTLGVLVGLIVTWLLRMARAR